MEKSVSSKEIRQLITITKIVPILIAIVHFLNCIVAYFYCNDIPLNYLGGISIIPIVYLYKASYVFRLCSYYRMFLHYSVIVNIINILDVYVGIPISDINYFILMLALTILTMLIVIYLKFLK